MVEIVVYPVSQTSTYVVLYVVVRTVFGDPKSVPCVGLLVTLALNGVASVNSGRYG